MKLISSIHKVAVLLVAALVAVAATSCKDIDNLVTTQLASPSVNAGDKSVSTLAFSWTKVEGASQYAYELVDANGNHVTGGVTTTTSMVATGLTANTEYTLKVWAYGPYGGDKTTSPTVELKATTNDYIQLATIQSIDAGSGADLVTITWPEVEHATAYMYSVYNEADSLVAEGTVGTNSFSAALDLGTYKATLVAISSDENYSNSEPVTFEFQRTKGEKWRRTGTLTSAVLGKSFKATLVCYADGTYELLSPYGEDGYSFAFKKNSDATFTITSVEPDEYSYYNFYVGSDYYANIYTSAYGSYSYSEFKGDETGGSMWWMTYLYTASGTNLGWGYEEFDWDGEGDEQVDQIPAGCKESVDPLMSTTWSQWYPYSNLCPTLTDGSHAATGCMATAMAQIMNYYKYPSTYSDGTTIDWGNMIDTYENGNFTDAQATAVATLMSKVGTAISMTYGASSTCYAENVESGIPTAFGYKVKYYGYRDYPTDKDETKWKAIIFKELSAGHPVLYGGTSYLNGYDNYFSHAFVIDGYKKNGMVHVNYGFGGAGDAWVTIDKMQMTGISGWSDENFDTYQTLTVIHRPQDGDIDYDL